MLRLFLCGTASNASWSEREGASRLFLPHQWFRAMPREGTKNENHRCLEPLL